MNTLLIYLKSQQLLIYGVAAFIYIIRVVVGTTLLEKLESLRLIDFLSTEVNFGEKECTLITPGIYNCYYQVRSKDKE
jgi:hypothetical protein